MAKKIYRYGISTTVDYTVDIFSLIEIIVRHKFDFISIGSDLRHNFFPYAEKFKEVKELCERHDIDINSIHVPFGVEYDIGMADKAGRQQAVGKVTEFLDYIAAIGIGQAIVHPHYYLDDIKEKVAERAAESVEKLILSKPDEVELVIENLPKEDGSWIAGYLLDIFDSSHIGFCFDSSHENMSGEPFHILGKYYNRLTTCHLSDNLGIHDDHMIPGEGKIDWAALKGYIDKAETFNDILFEVGTGEKLPIPVEDYVKKTKVAAIRIFG